MITIITTHWVLPDKVEQAKELFLANGLAMRTIPGFISRLILQSKSDPQKWTLIARWKDEEAIKTWRDSPNHIWDRYGETPIVPPGSNYFKKYGQAGSVQAKAGVNEIFEFISEI